MDQKFKSRFYLILSFIVGCVFFYFLSKTFLKDTFYETNSIHELASEKINFLKENISKYDIRSNTASSIAAKIDTLTIQITGTLYSANLKDQMKYDSNETSLYSEYILPFDELFKRNGITLMTKFSDRLLGYYFDQPNEDPAITAMKEFNPDEEISKVFYAIFPKPDPFYFKQSNNKILYQSYSDSSFNSDKKELVRGLNQLKPSLLEASKIASRKKEESMKKMSSYMEEMSSLKNMNINKITLYIALPLFALILIAVFLIPSQYSDKQVQILFIEKNIIKDVITIFLLTSTIILLGLSKVIDSQVIGTLLGGISVYVLQKSLDLKQNGNKSEKNEEKSETSVPKGTENASEEGVANSSNIEKQP